MMFSYDIVCKNFQLKRKYYKIFEKVAFRAVCCISLLPLVKPTTVVASEKKKTFQIQQKDDS